MTQRVRVEVRRRAEEAAYTRRAEVVAAYRTGSLKSAANRFDVGVTWLRAALVAWGEPIRAQGPPTVVPRITEARKWVLGHLDGVVASYREGESLEALHKRLGVSHSWLRQRLVEAGVTIRSTAEAKELLDTTHTRPRVTPRRWNRSTR